MQCALDLRNTVPSPVSIKKVSLEGRVSILRLIELDLDSLVLGADKKVYWPEQVADHSCCHLDGALVLYNVMNRDSMVRVSHVLSKQIS